MKRQSHSPDRDGSTLPGVTTPGIDVSIATAKPQMFVISVVPIGTLKLSCADRSGRYHARQWAAVPIGTVQSKTPPLRQSHSPDRDGSILPGVTTPGIDISIATAKPRCSSFLLSLSGLSSFSVSIVPGVNTPGSGLSSLSGLSKTGHRRYGNLIVPIGTVASCRA
jgi:hypothetical protein